MPNLYRLRPILASIPNIEPFFQEAERVLRQEGQEFEYLYNDFVRSWSSKPLITSTVKMDRKRGIGGVFTYPVGDEDILNIIRWVIYGTKPHDIPLEPKEPPDLLHYQGVFVPKTTPGIITSGPGGKFGPYNVHARQVHHPGIVPRRTLDLILRKRALPYFKNMENAMKVALRRSVSGATPGR